MPGTSPPRRNSKLVTEYIQPDLLTPMPGAPRLHPKSQFRALTKSVQSVGQVLPILIDAERRIISGHAIWEVAKRLGMAEVMVIRIEYLSEPQIKALMIALNRISELSKWDDKALATILLDLQTQDLGLEIEMTGFTEIEIELKVEALDGDDGDMEPDIEVGAGPAVANLGELWQLGDHRLFCANALDDLSWAAVMGKDRATLVVTDPPYNLPVDGFVSGLGKHRHRAFPMGVGEMNEFEFTNFLKTAMTRASKWSTAGSVHVWAIDWRHMVEIGTAGRTVYDRLLNMAVWVKNQAGMGSFLRSQHELFFIFAREGAPPRNNVQLGRFGRSRSNVWSYPSAASLARTAEEGDPLAMHPTVKPLALVCDVLLDVTGRGDVVADPFVGSGTVIIAAEKLGRKARAIELDPRHVDTAIRRWQRWTGQAAKRVADGLSFDEVAAKNDAGNGGAKS